MQKNRRSKMISQYPLQITAPKVDAQIAFILLKSGAAIKPRHSGTARAEETTRFIPDYIP